MYAIIKTGGKQYRVSPGDVLAIEKITGAEEGEIIELNHVLAFDSGDGIVVGRPLIQYASVKATVLDQKKDSKIIVIKKRRRKNYRRMHGHRQLITIIRIEEIQSHPALDSKAPRGASDITSDEPLSGSTPLSDVARDAQASSYSGAGAPPTNVSVDVPSLHLSPVREASKPMKSAMLDSKPWLYRKETISGEVASRFIRATAWWLTHPSGPVRAPRHADRLVLSRRHGWMLEFGANALLVGKALERSRERVLEFDRRLDAGESVWRSEVRRAISDAVASSVANHAGDEYDYYPRYGEELVFGAQGINLSDAADFVVEEAGIDILLSPG